MISNFPALGPARHWQTDGRDPAVGEPGGDPRPFGAADGRSPDQTEPRNWPTETSDEVSPDRTSSGSSLVRNRSTPTPRPRETARSSGSGRAPWRAISAQATSVAVGGVGGELVSGGSSLILREGTRKSSEIGASLQRMGRDFRARPEGWRRIPCDQEQGINSRE